MVLSSIFLLGGKDLEMLTIKKFLIAQGLKEGENIFDNQLEWGAKLSAYQEVLKKFPDISIYGIELEEDITPPRNYHRIDHHNDFSEKEASLIQVLKLFEKEPTREHLLIAYNDVGHIEAMECFGATKEEIAKIRKRDRASQGVSEEEEFKALEELKRVEEKNGLFILRSTLAHFSPIVDNFQKRPFLLYSEKHLIYYGEIDFLKKKYKEQVEKHQAYHGRGFFGFDSGYLTSGLADRLAGEIIEMSKKKKMISYHNFMFLIK